MTDASYIELRAHSAFSLLRGATPPDDLLAEAARLGMPALALTDHNNVYGAVGFQKTAQSLGIQPILGAELTLEDDRALTLLVGDETGWSNLCWLITQAQHQAPKGEGLLRFEQMDGHTDGLIALSGGREGAITRKLERDGMRGARQLARRYAALFPDGRFWIELHHHRMPYDEQRIAALTTLAESLDLGVVATNHAHYPRAQDRNLADVVTAIRHNRSLDEASAFLFPNAHRYLKSTAEMRTLFRRYPGSHRQYQTRRRLVRLSAAVGIAGAAEVSVAGRHDGAGLPGRFVPPVAALSAGYGSPPAARAGDH